MSHILSLPQARARWKDGIPRALRLWRASLGPNADMDAALEEAAAAAVAGAQATLAGKLRAARQMEARLEAVRLALAEQVRHGS